MTIKFNYKCNSCAYEYVEQRGNYELNLYFTTCHSCGLGTYEETGQTVLSPEPELSPGPVVEEPPAE